MSGGGDPLSDRPAIVFGLSDLRYWIWVLRRRLWLIALVAGVMAAAGVAVALSLPPVYEARARLLVESQQIPEELVRSTVNAPVSEQIAVIRQRLTTRETLLELAERHRVFPPGSEATPTERVQAMASALRFEQDVLGASRRRRGDTVSTAFTIRFTARTAPIAAAVVNDLLTQVLSQSAEIRRSRAANTSAFFLQEVDRLAAALTRMEGQITEFQTENEAALPDSLDYRRGQLTLLQERAQRLELEAVNLEQERATLRLMLGAGGSGGVASAVTPSGQDLATLRRTMAQRRAILSENHPEIRALARRIEALERIVAAEAEAAAATAADATATVSPDTMNLRQRLALVDARLEFNERALIELRGRQEELQRSILATPNVLMEMNQLQRAYEDLEQRYSAARSKLAEAEAGEQLEDKSQGERFEVIERATPPERPIKPNRRAIAAAGAGAGMAGGLGLVVLLELFSGAIRRPEDLARIGVEPVAVIPYIETSGERLRRWGLRLGVVALIVGVAAAAAWAVHVHYLPLETVTERVLEKTGLDETVETLRRRFGG